MAWEWVPFATVVVTSTATVTVAWRGYRHGERLAGERTEHEQQLARDARRYQRLTDAYVPLLRFAFRVGQWSDLVRPMIELGQSPPAPPLPTLEEQADVDALIAAHASTEVKDLMRAWRDALTNVRKADRIIGFAQSPDAHGSINAGEQWLKLEQEYRPAERATRQDISDQVSRELGDGPAKTAVGAATLRGWLTRRRTP
jgi:hypothetical protein